MILVHKSFAKYGSVFGALDYTQHGAILFVCKGNASPYMHGDGGGGGVCV